MTLAHLTPDELSIPAELSRAWHEPDELRLIQSADGALYIKPVDFADRMKAGIKRLLRRTDAASWFKNNGGSSFALRGRRTHSAPVGDYRIANYDQTVCLIPADQHADSESRQKQWADYTGYHEHRPLVEQDEGANKVSKWLADVCLSLDPDSFLELGCGAGRNLYWLNKANPSLSLSGVEINPHAVREANRYASVQQGSIYDLAHLPSRSVDIVLTSGVLMHVPEERVGGVIREARRIARKAVVHFELHGPSHSFDYHRYPRDYGALYSKLGLNATYTIFPRRDFRSRTTQSFHHALLLHRVKSTDNEVEI
jgi:SAM-dependent methyltransferase